MRKFYLLLMVVFCTMLLNNCKSDDTEQQSQTEAEMPKEAFRLQLVEASFSEPLSQEEYNGTLDGTPIKLVRTDEHTLLFYIPGSVAVGQTVFTVPQLNVSNTLEIKDSDLKGSAATVLQPVFEKTTPEYQEIANAEYSTYLNTVNQAFTDYYQTLSAEEKNEMALFYQVNEPFFAEMLNPDLQGKSVRETARIAARFTIATYLFVTGSVALTLPGTPVEKAVIGAVAITGAVKAWDFGKQLVNSVSIVTGISNELFGGKSGNKTLGTDNLTFVNDVAQNVPLYTEQRTMTTADRSSNADILTTFFSAFDDLTDATKTANKVISLINDHVFFVNIPPIPLYEIPVSAEKQDTPLTEEAFGYLKFSVADSNVKITETSFENGTVRMKLNITNPNAVTGDAISTQLNYTYTEDFNNVTGSMPIEVKLEKEEEVPSVNEIQFSLNIDGWTYQSNDFTSDGIHKRGSSCDITYYKAIVNNKDHHISITGELNNFMNSPIGTTYQFGGYTAPGSGIEYTCKKNSTYITIQISLKGDYPNCNSGTLVEIDSLVEQGTFTKTGSYSFSFSGTVVTCGGSGYKTGQISGKGTLVP